MAFTAILSYACGVLFFVFWVYLNTRIVCSLVPKERYLLRTFAWGLIGLISFVFVYALFMCFVMLMVLIANIFMEFTA